MTGPAKPRARSFRKLALALLFIVPALFFVKLATEARDREPLSGALDVRILEWIHSFANPALNQVAIHATNLGGPEVIVVVTALVAGLQFYLRKRQAMTILLIGVGGAAIINTLLKLSFHRLRPSLWAPIVTEPSFSFPSGHAMMSSALAFSLILILWQTRWRWYAVAIGLAYTLIIGLTRLYLGVHFPTDVLAGWIVSFIWLLTVNTILTRRQFRAAAREMA